jgi:hypothetical protein
VGALLKNMEESSLENAGSLPEKDPRTELSPEDQAVFVQILDTIGRNDNNFFAGAKGEERFWKTVWIIKASHAYDVDYEINKRLGRFIGNPEVEALIAPIRNRGYRSTAKSFLLAATEEGMRYGKGTIEERIAEAEKYAKKAGVTLEDIAKEAGVEIKEEE